MKTAMIGLFSICLLFGGCQRGARTSASPEEVSKAERQDYQALVQARLNEFDHRFDGLEARMKGLPEPDRQRLKTDIAELRDRKDALQHKFNDLKGVSVESWRDLKSSMDRGLDQLELAYNVVAANNYGNSGTPQGDHTK
jgi:hypothetical protein